jgi:hypothetical protein
MTTAADDVADEAAFEAFLAGRPVSEEAAGLAAFAGAVRATATVPGRPNAALAELLATGLLTDQSSPSIRTAPSAGSPPRRSRVRIRRRFAMFFTALLAKLLSAGAVAQAATGAGVVLVVATGAGATGLLGEDVQDTVSSVVGTATTDESTAPEDRTETVTTTDPGEVDATEGETTVPVEPAEVTEDAELVEVQVKAWALEGPAEGESFSAWVSEGSNAGVKGWLRARGMTFGNVVSAWANGKNFSDEQLAALGAGLDEPTDAPTEPAAAEVVETDTEVAATTEDGASRGNGNGKATTGNATSGNGKATSGNGRGNGKN